MTNNEIVLIKKALLNVEMREVKFMDSFPQVDLPHSQQYIENMNNLTHTPTRVLPKKVFSKNKFIICIIAALLMFVTACKFKEPILDFFEETYENFTKLSTKEDVDEEIGSVYTPGYIPSGYEVVSQSSNKIGLSIIWSNGTHKIVYNQSPLNNQNTFIDTENNNYISLYIGEQPVYYILKNGTYFFIWENDHYSFKLKCSDIISISEVKKIILSIQK